MKRSHVIAAALALGAAGWILSGQVDGETPVSHAGDATEQAALTEGTAQAADDAPLPVRVRVIRAEDRVSEVVLFGRTEANREVDLKAETASRVVKRPVLKGEAVKKGDLVVELARDDRGSRLREAQALVEQRRIAYEAAKKLSAKNYRSKVKLAEEKAELESAKAALANIRLDIARTTIEAPFDGIVDDFPIEIGDYIAVGASVAKVIDLDPILLVVEVAERDVGGLHVGARARARLVTGDEIDGVVSFVSKAGSKATRTFRVEIAVDNPGGDIAEGLTAEVHLPLARVRAHRVTPAVLTLSDEGAVGVKAVSDDGTVVFHAVRVVDDTPDGMWVTGLPESVTVITVGQEFVRTGQKVAPVDEKSLDAGQGEG